MGLFKSIGSVISPAFSLHTSDTFKDIVSFGGHSKKKGIDAGIASQEKMYQRGREDLAPYREAGAEMLPYLLAGAKDNPYRGMLEYLATGKGTAVNFQDSPMYQYRKEQEEEALNKYLAGQGKLGSGAGVTAYSKMMGRLGAEESDRHYNRIKDLFNAGNIDYNKMMGIASMGSGAAGSSANNAMQLGSSLNAAEQAKGNIMGETIGNWVDLGTSLYGASQYGKGRAPKAPAPTKTWSV